MSQGSYSGPQTWNSKHPYVLVDGMFGWNKMCFFYVQIWNHHHHHPIENKPIKNWFFRVPGTSLEEMDTTLEVPKHMDLWIHWKTPISSFNEFTHPNKKTKGLEATKTWFFFGLMWLFSKVKTWYFSAYSRLVLGAFLSENVQSQTNPMLFQPGILGVISGSLKPPGPKPPT